MNVAAETTNGHATDGLYARALAARAGPVTIRLLPEVVNLELYAGDGATISLTVSQEDDTPLPLTGVVEAHVRLNRPDPDPPLADWHVDMTQAAQGEIVLSLTGAQTASLMELPSGALALRFRGHWDVQWTPAGAEPLTIIQGDLGCALDVTRP